LESGCLEGLTDDEAGTALGTGGAGTGKTVIVARLDAETDVRRGKQLSLRFDANKLHFFDLDDGSALRTKPAQEPSLVSSPPSIWSGVTPGAA
jgi:hypothetical protein